MMDVKSGKAFADFIIALNNDIKFLYAGDEKQIEDDDINSLLNTARLDFANSLSEASEKGESFHSSIFVLSLDILVNYCLFDNMQVARVKNYELLLRRYDAVWGYFKRFVDSFSLLEAQVQRGGQNSKENPS